MSRRGGPQKKTIERALAESGADFQRAWRRAIAACESPDSTALSELRAFTEWAVHAGEIEKAVKAAAHRLPYECVRKGDSSESASDARRRKIDALKAEIAELESSDDM